MTQAIKVLNLDKLYTKASRELVHEIIYQEVSILKMLNHRNIIKLYDALEDPNQNKVFLAMEYCARGCFLSEENQSGWPAQPIPLERLRRYTRQLAEAVHYLHEVAHVIHNDLKPDNILISDEDEIKICDFGTAWTFGLDGNDKLRRYDWGTKVYLPPEVWLKKEARGRQVDVWSLGCIFYELAYGEHPLKELFIRCSSEHEVAAGMLGLSIVFPPNTIDPRFHQMVAQMLESDPSLRADITVVLSSPLFKQQ